MFPIAANRSDEEGPLYSDDVFSTYLYTGNGSTQTITNGIDLAGKGGMVWLKPRSVAVGHALFDSNRGTNNYIASETTNAQSVVSGPTFTSTGFNLNGSWNGASTTYASWTFRKAAKFFDVQTVTHTNGTATNIDLSVLGTVGMVIAKITTTTGAWTVWQRSLTASNNLKLNTTAAQSTTDAWLSVSGTTATLSASAPTGTYVIYAYAHDTSSTGIIQCGSFTTDASGSATVNLGWEPQYVMVKITSSPGGSWDIQDNMRGFTAKPTVYTANPILKANESSAENTIGANTLQLNSTGFTTDNATYNPSKTYIYMAIRMPNKPPTSGTQVYNAIARAGTSAVATVTGVGFPLDLSIIRGRAVGYSWRWGDRLRGVFQYLRSNLTNAEVTDTDVTSFNMDGITFPATGVSLTNAAGGNYINYFLKRAPGFFDEVCYTGTGTATTQAHNLGVVPEMMIVKCRSVTASWAVYVSSLSANNALFLNDSGTGSTGAIFWNSTTPTSSVFSIGTAGATNVTPNTYVAYLFATLAGISKVGSYTGNGSSQNIECGFAAGARFVLVKATSTTGDWLVADTARGIVSGNDPRLSLNSTAAEVTGDDWLDPYAPGFTVNQTTASANASGVSYIFLAIS